MGQRWLLPGNVQALLEELPCPAWGFWADPSAPQMSLWSPNHSCPGFSQNLQLALGVRAPWGGEEKGFVGMFSMAWGALAAPGVSS